MAAPKKILSSGVLVRDPETDEAVFLPAGAVPDTKFKKQISSSHLVTSGKEPKPKAQNVTKAEPQEPETTEVEETEDPDEENADPEQDFGTE